MEGTGKHVENEEVVCLSDVVLDMEASLLRWDCDVGLPAAGNNPEDGVCLAEDIGVKPIGIKRMPELLLKV